MVVRKSLLKGMGTVWALRYGIPPSIPLTQVSLFPQAGRTPKCLRRTGPSSPLEGKQQCLYFPPVQRFARPLFRPLVSSLQTVSVPKRAVHLLIIPQTFVTEEKSNHEVPHRWDRSFSSHDCFPRWDFFNRSEIPCLHHVWTHGILLSLFAFSLSPFYLRNAGLRAVWVVVVVVVRGGKQFVVSFQLHNVPRREFIKPKSIRATNVNL